MVSSATRNTSYPARRAHHVALPHAGSRGRRSRRLPRSVPPRLAGRRAPPRGRARWAAPSRHGRPLAPDALRACPWKRPPPTRSPFAVPTPLHAALSALTLLAIVLPIALAAWTVLYVRRHWRSWVVYSPPALDAPDAARSDADRRAPTPRDRQAGADGLVVDGTAPGGSRREAARPAGGGRSASRGDAASRRPLRAPSGPVGRRPVGRGPAAEAWGGRTYPSPTSRAR